MSQRVSWIHFTTVFLASKLPNWNQHFWACHNECILKNSNCKMNKCQVFEFLLNYFVIITVLTMFHTVKVLSILHIINAGLHCGIAVSAFTSQALVQILAVWSLHVLPACVGFSSGTPASSYSPKNMLRRLNDPNCP